MRLSDKLKRLRPMPGGASPGEASRPAQDGVWRPHGSDPTTEPTRSAEDERLRRLRSMMGETLGRGRRRGQVRAATGPQPLPVGEICAHVEGPYHRVQEHCVATHCHGHAPVGAALEVSSELVASLALDTQLAGLDLSRMVVLDTETTGLAGGAGTVPFLIGISYFEQGCLKVEQLFLRNLGEEVPMLHVLAEHIARASCVVSYNGKSFDWPLLRSRFILNRVPAPELPPHLDLLHCARRLWKGRMEAVRLVDVERELLGFTRVDDVEGAEIPGLYMRYLRGEDPNLVVPILKHNALDVIALPAMLGVMGKHFAEVQAQADPRDLLAYAKVAARARDEGRAVRFAEAAVEAGTAGGQPELSVEALRIAAGIARRRGDSQGARGQLERAVQAAASVQDALLRSEVHLELAKLLEHQLRDPRAALRHALHTELAEGPDGHGRRRGRLVRRLLHAER